MEMFDHYVVCVFTHVPLYQHIYVAMVVYEQTRSCIELQNEPVIACMYVHMVISTT